MSEPDFPRFALVYTSARPDWIAPVLERWFGRALRPELIAAVVCVASWSRKGFSTWRYSDTGA